MGLGPPTSKAHRWSGPGQSRGPRGWRRVKRRPWKAEKETSSVGESQIQGHCLKMGLAAEQAGRR